MKAPIIFAMIFLALCAIIILADFINVIKLFGKPNRKRTIKIVDRLVIFISILVLPASILWDFNFLQYKKAIPHKDWESITLNDFRGLKKPNYTLYGETKFAFVSTSIKVKKHKHYILVETLFHPCRSYVYNRKLYANDLLTHEMYHFHITEFCARLMRQEIQNCIRDSLEININKIKKKYLSMEDGFQIEYDDETYHSYVRKKQVEWQNKIDTFLLNLEDYSNSIISLK